MKTTNCEYNKQLFGYVLSFLLNCKTCCSFQKIDIKSLGKANAAEHKVRPIHLVILTNLTRKKIHKFANVYRHYQNKNIGQKEEVIPVALKNVNDK